MENKTANGTKSAKLEAAKHKGRRQTGEAARLVTKEALSPATGPEISVSTTDVQSRRDLIIDGLRLSGEFSPPKTGDSTDAKASFAQSFAIAKPHFRHTMQPDLHGYAKQSE